MIILRNRITNFRFFPNIPYEFLDTAQGGNRMKIRVITLLMYCCLHFRYIKYKV